MGKNPGHRNVLQNRIIKFFKAFNVICKISKKSFINKVLADRRFKSAPILSQTKKISSLEGSAPNVSQTFFCHTVLASNNVPTEIVQRRLETLRVGSLDILTK